MSQMRARGGSQVSGSKAFPRLHGLRLLCPRKTCADSEHALATPHITLRGKLSPCWSPSASGHPAQRWSSAFALIPYRPFEVWSGCPAAQLPSTSSPERWRSTQCSGCILWGSPRTSPELPISCRTIYPACGRLISTPFRESFEVFRKNAYPSAMQASGVLLGRASAEAKGDPAGEWPLSKAPKICESMQQNVKSFDILGRASAEAKEDTAGEWPDVNSAVTEGK